MPKPEGTGIYIRQISSAHVPLPALYKNLPKREGNCSAVIIGIPVGSYSYGVTSRYNIIIRIALVGTE